MWAFFIVLFGGGYYLLKYLFENASHAAIDQDWAMNEEKFKGLNSSLDNSLAIEIEMEKKWPCELEEVLEPIMDDLHDIFGDVDDTDIVGYFKRYRRLYIKWILLLLESKNGNLPGLPGISTWIEADLFCGLETYEEFKGWVNIHECDTWSYKKYISLRFCKKIEENIRKKYPDLKFVFPKGNQYPCYRERYEIHLLHRVGLNNYHKFRRLWDDAPLTAESARKYIFNPPN